MALTMRTSKKVNLSRQEMDRIPQLIGLKRWRPMRSTGKLSDWQPKPFTALAARGHTLSVPLFRLDRVNTKVITVGREPGNDLIISDPTVSRHHAQLYHQNGHWIVNDLESTSGTFVSYSGNPKKESQVQGREFALKNHSIVRFGPAAYTLLLHESSENKES
jgi:pSer/pThr/pTyr-binding forkhead associated (FHA) protein